MREPLTQGSGPMSVRSFAVNTSRFENEPCSDGRADDLLGHLGTQKVIESLASTMTGYQIFGFNLFEGRDDLSNVVVVQWRDDVEAADESMHLLNARSGLRLPNCIDDTAVTT